MSCRALHFKNINSSSAQVTRVLKVLLWPLYLLKMSSFSKSNYFGFIFQIQGLWLYHWKHTAILKFLAERSMINEIKSDVSSFASGFPPLSGCQQRGLLLASSSKVLTLLCVLITEGGANQGSQWGMRVWIFRSVQK